MPQKKKKTSKDTVPPVINEASAQAILFGLTTTEYEERAKLAARVERAMQRAKVRKVSFETVVVLELSFLEEGIKINSRDLARFLTSFARLYSSGSQIRAGASILDVFLRHGLVHGLLPRPRPNPNFEITAISYNSPLTIVLMGCAIGLVLAVIISGGEIDFSLKGVKAKLPCLGEGISALRKALYPNAKREGLAYVAKRELEEQKLLEAKNPKLIEERFKAAKKLKGKVIGKPSRKKK